MRTNASTSFRVGRVPRHRGLGRQRRAPHRGDGVVVRERALVQQVSRRLVRGAAWPSVAARALGVRSVVWAWLLWDLLKPGRHARTTANTRR